MPKHAAANFCLLSLTLTLGSSAFAATQIGQGAKFVIDHSNDRTTSLIEGGTIATKIVDFAPDAIDGHVYKVKADLSLDLQVLGAQSSSQVSSVPEHYIDHTLIDTLRADGRYADSHLKAEHLGYEDVVTADGHSYSHCDKVRLYDLKLAKSDFAFAPVTALVAQAVAAQSAAFASPLGLPDAKDINLVAALCDDVPVFGVAKLDIAVRVLGNDVKIGVDYAAE